MGKLGGLVLGFAVGVSVVPACTESASTPNAGPLFTDGTRLKAVHQLIDGAPSLFLNWYDTELGVDCSFINERFLDRPVCFPSDTGQPTFARYTNRFADSNCSTQVLGSFNPGESRYFLQSPDADAGCGAVTRLFHVGQVVPSDTPLYVMDSTGSTGTCQLATGTGDGYTELRLLGPEIPIDALVQGTARHNAGAGRIVPLFIAGDDGSIQGAIADDTSVIAWDNQRNEIVTASTWFRPGNRWFPFTFDAGYFLNAACTTRAALGFVCPQQTVPKTGSVSTFDSCGGRATTDVFDLGPRLSGRPTLYYSDPNINACLEHDEWPVTDSRYEMFSVGAAIPLTDFPEAIEVRTGTGQLRIVQAGSPAGPAMAGVGLFDSVHGQPCSFSLTAADGAVRCLPQTIDTGSYFADAACTIPVVTSLPPENPCAPRPTLASWDEPAGQRRRHIYPIGDPYVGMVYLKLPTDSECFLLGNATSMGSEQAFAVGPEIPPTDFAPENLVRPN